jgi:putative ABC transport system permease protein
MHDRISRIALYLVPRNQRVMVRRDLDDEAHRLGRGSLWCAAHLMLIGIRLRATFGGGAMLLDLRHAVRSLRHARWFTIGAALTFALGIGINLAVFSAVDRILFRALPFANSHELMLLRVCNAQSGACSAGSFPDLIPEEAGDRLTTLGEMALVATTGTYATSVADHASPLRLTSVSPNLLRVLGVRPVLGRDVSDDEVRTKSRVALVSYETFERRFAADLAVIGRPVGPGAQSPMIIGILPKGFVSPAWGMADPKWDGFVIGPNPLVIAPIARLRAGHTREAAQAEIDALVAALAPRFPRRAADRGAVAPPFVAVEPLEHELFDSIQHRAWLISAAAGLILLMACANLAGLVLARGRSREHEAAIRRALGASSARVIAGSIAETLLVCLLGAAIALGLLWWSSSVLVGLLPPTFARYMVHALDARVVVAAILAATACAVVAGAWPGARVARANVNPLLQRGRGAGRRTRLRGGRGLLVVESALGVVLVLGAALTVRSFVTLSTQDPGYRADDLYSVAVQPAATTAIDPQASLRDFESVLEIAANVPGVVAIAGGDAVISSGRTVWPFASGDAVRGGRYEITAGYFRALGTRLVTGREFDATEVRSRAPVGLLNPAAVSAVWPGTPPADAIGRHLELPGEPPRLIVGIVPPITRGWRGDGTRDDAQLYVPLGTRPRNYSMFLLRTEPGAAVPLDVLRARIADRLGARRVEVFPAMTALNRELRDPRFRAALFGVFGICALLLAAAGLYALAAFEVSLRRWEMGLRMTLGASASEIRRLVIGGAVRPVLIGIITGGVIAFWAATFLERYLYELDARDPLTFAAVVAALLATAVIAAWIPARRAARTDPAAVLRAQ